MLTLALAIALQAAPAQLTVEVAPSGSELLVDGKKTKARVLKLSPGKHTLRVVYKGDAHEEEILIKAGEKKTWKWEFEGVVVPKKKEEPQPTDESGPGPDSTDSPD